jgi:hypothetical protein
MDASFDSLFLCGLPQRFCVPPLGLHADGRMGIIEFLIEVGIPESVSNHSMALRV